MGRTGAVVAVLCLSCFLVASAANYTNILRQGEQLRYGERLESSNQLFSLGFLTPDDAVYANSFVAIWCNNRYDRDEKYPNGTWPAPWIGNRNHPINRGDGVLSLGSNGGLNIKIHESQVDFLYVGGDDSVNASAVLQDNGNFVIHELNSDGSVKRILWQSFDHPTDSLLPGMRLGINNNLTSRVNNSSPEPGLFTLGMNRYERTHPMAA